MKTVGFFLLKFGPNLIVVIPRTGVVIIEVPLADCIKRAFIVTREWHPLLADG
jgi:hypothetical protein